MATGVPEWGGDFPQAGRGHLAAACGDVGYRWPRAEHDGHAPGPPTVFLDSAGFGARANGDRSYLDRPEAGQSPGDPPGP